MNVLVICGRAGRHPWATGALVSRACDALTSAGHAVHLRAQSIDDPRAFGRCASVEAFDTFDQTSTDWPFGFARWARRKSREVAHDVSVSFSRVAGGHVWMPIEPSGGSWLTRARRSLSAKSLAITLTRHHGFLRTMATESMLVAPRMSRGRIRRVLAVGSTSAGEAARLLHDVHDLGGRVTAINPFSMIEPPMETEAEHMRASTRQLLGIPGERVALLVLAPQPVGTRCDPMLLACASLAGRGESPLIIAFAKDCFAMHAAGVRCQVGGDVRVLPLSSSIGAAVAAADVFALPIKADKGVFLAGGLARGAAMAVRFGKPLLAQSGASGYELARTRSSAQEMPGLVIDAPTKEHWERALKTAMDPAWRGRAAEAARDVGAELTFARFARHFVRAVEETAAEVRGEPDA